jgi:hypothetical protein
VTHVYVTCSATVEGAHDCAVRVGDDPAATVHRVRVTPESLRRYGGDHPDVQTLVRDSFAFLLEREPRESVLRSFELSDIERYFPEYSREITRTTS